jgi:hypothetical protein
MAFPPNFQLTHQYSGEIICYSRLYTEKQLRKTLGIAKEDWSRQLGRNLPEADTVVDGQSLWTDTTLKAHNVL